MYFYTQEVSLFLLCAPLSRFFRGMSIAPPRKLYPFAMILKPRLSQLIYPCQFPYLEWAGLEADVGGA